MILHNFLIDFEHNFYEAHVENIAQHTDDQELPEFSENNERRDVFTLRDNIANAIWAEYQNSSWLSPVFCSQSSRTPTINKKLLCWSDLAIPYFIVFSVNSILKSKIEHVMWSVIMLKSLYYIYF